MMKRSQLIRNVASNWVHIVWGVIWGLVMTPIFIKTLGTSEYGIWLLIHGLVGNYGLLDLGTRSAVVRYVSKGLAEKDDNYVNELLNTALVLYIGVGALAVLVSVILGFSLPRIEGFVAGSHPDLTLLIILLGANVAISLPGRLLEGVLSAAERFDISNGFAMGFSLVRNLLFIFLLFDGGGLITLSWALLATTAVEKILVAIIVIRQVPAVRLSRSYARRSRVRTIFNYGIFTFLAQAGERLRLYTDSLVIGAVLPAAAITVFSIGQRPLLYLSKVSLGISRVLTPAFSRTEATSDNTHLGKMLISGTRAATLINSLACLLLAVSGDRLIRLWVGNEFGESVTILFLLLPAYLLTAGTTPINSVLLGTSRHQLLSVVTIVEGVVNLGLSVILIHKMGLPGVALGTAIPMTIARLWVLPAYACRAIDLSYGKYLLRALAPSLPGLVVGGGAALLLMRWITGEDLLSVVILDLLVAAAFLAATLLTMYLTKDPLLPGTGFRPRASGA